MSSLPFHQGFFFLDAFISIGPLVHPYHSIRSLRSSNAMPHADPISVRLCLFMTHPLTVVAKFICPRGVSEQAIHPRAQPGGIYDTDPFHKIAMWSRIRICYGRRDGSVASSHSAADLVDRSPY